jgi:hypothetical protein
MLISKFDLILCLPFDHGIHGFDKNSSPDIMHHFICDYIYNLKTINLEKELRARKNSIHYSFLSHYRIQNRNTGIQIAHVFYQEQGGECVGILVTFWIRIFIRLCKNRIQRILKRQKILKDFRYRQQREIRRLHP